MPVIDIVNNDKDRIVLGNEDIHIFSKCSGDVSNIDDLPKSYITLADLHFGFSNKFLIGMQKWAPSKDYEYRRILYLKYRKIELARIESNKTIDNRTSRNNAFLDALKTLVINHDIIKSTPYMKKCIKTIGILSATSNTMDEIKTSISIVRNIMLREIKEQDLSLEDQEVLEAALTMIVHNYSTIIIHSDLSTCMKSIGIIKKQFERSEAISDTDNVKSIYDAILTVSIQL